MRVITGIYKGRHFDIPRTFKARPTTDFAKENIFNVLNGYIDFDGAAALDLFAGTGSISLEMLSRGCRPVVSVEADRDHAHFISECMKKIGTRDNVLIRGDVFRFLKNATSSSTSSSPTHPTLWRNCPQSRPSSSTTTSSSPTASSSSSMARPTTSPTRHTSLSIAAMAASTSRSSDEDCRVHQPHRSPLWLHTYR